MLTKMVDGVEVVMSKEEEAQIRAEWAAFEANRENVANKKFNEEIYKKLEDIDIKSIRALRTDDKDRLIQLEEEAKVLRAQIIK